LVRAETALAGRHILGAIGVAVVAVVALLAFAWRPAIAPIAPPSAAGFPSDLIDKGEMLAGAGNCIDCHTAPDGQANAGGKPLYTRVGYFYSPNLTPDPETGIGAWSEAAFTRALREGVSRDGRHLFPVFPYTHYTQLEDADVRALYAYFMTRPPVKAPNRPNTILFPLDVRPLQALWKSLFFKPGRYRPDPGRDPRWNRGAYLAEAVAGCADCHTDRNGVGAEQVGHPYAGAVIDGWHAEPLDISPSPARWSEAEFFAYLRRGESPPHGVAVGPMRAVVRGLAKLPDDDLRAIATYFVSLNRPSGAALEPGLARALAPLPPKTDEQRRGETLYLNSCADCHGAPGKPPTTARSPLGLNTALWDPYRPYNLIRTVLDGIGARDGLPGAMPGFRATFSDADLKAIATYLRTSYTTLPVWGLLDELTLERLRSDPMSLR
jgi:mono/diheme cytochrome c family protein